MVLVFGKQNKSLRGLARDSVHWVGKIIAPPFVYVGPPPLVRLKMTATDPAFRWCRLLDLVFAFHLEIVMFVPKK